ncbi:MAG: hypothetical protein WC728_14675 [Elusimicrobiota bacterium]
MASEIRLVEQTVSRLSRRFCQKPRAKIVNELLAGLLEEKRARQARNLDHWPEHGPKFLARLAKRWKVDEAKRLNRTAAVLRERRRDAAKLALAITDNRTDAEVAVSDSDLDLLADAVKERFYLLAVKRNALDVVRRRQLEQDKFVPLEEAFETADDRRGEPMDGMGGAVVTITAFMFLSTRRPSLTRSL